MGIISELNSPIMYLIVGVVVAFVALVGTLTVEPSDFNNNSK